LFFFPTGCVIKWPLLVSGLFILQIFFHAFFFLSKGGIWGIELGPIYLKPHPQPPLFFGETEVWTRASHLQGGTIYMLEPHFQFILLQLFWRWSLGNYLPRLASKSNLPNLSLPRS
jgi:hypothetical protein